MNIHEGAVCFARCPLPAGPFDGGPHGGVQRMQRMQLCNTPPARRMHVQETDGRAEFGWCSALYCAGGRRRIREDLRGLARQRAGRVMVSRRRDVGRRQREHTAGFLLRTCRLPPPRTCHGHAAPPERCLTVHLVRGKGTHQAQKVWPIVHSRPRRHPWSWKRACCLSTFHNQHILHTVHRA